MRRPVRADPARSAAASRRTPGHRVGDRPCAHDAGDPRPGGRPHRLGRPPPRLRRRRQPQQPSAAAVVELDVRPGAGRSRGRRQRRSRARRRPGRHRQDHARSHPPSPSSAPTVEPCSVSPRRRPQPRCSPTRPASHADTLDKLLIEHRLDRPPDHRYDLPVGTTVIVDEAGMLPTAKLAELADLADVKGWRVALVGDPLQFSAVGRGGMFGLLVDTFGADRARPRPPLRQRLGTRRQPPTPPRRRRRRRDLRRPRPAPRRHPIQMERAQRRPLVGAPPGRQVGSC